MNDLAWGGHTNGSIPSADLVDVSGLGDYLEPTAASQFVNLVAACHAATGVTLRPAPGSSAYRPLSIQQSFYAQREAYLAGTGPFFPTAAYPGTSNHGWARAVDITGYEGSTRWRSPRTGTVYAVHLTVWNWLLAHAADYGFDWTTGDYSSEAWHWESLTPPGTAVASVDGATTIPQGDEFDMASLADLQSIVTTVVNAAVDDIKSGIRREGRGRLYYCATPPAGLPQFVCIFWERDPKDGANILYATGETQADHWNTIYSQTADSVAQAKAAALAPAQFQTMINLALGTDSAFTNPVTAAAQ